MIICVAQGLFQTLLVFTFTEFTEGEFSNLGRLLHWKVTFYEDES